jgi:predicted RNA-binding protein with PIN domain
LAHIAEGVRRAAEAAGELAGALAETAAALGDTGGDPDGWASAAPEGPAPDGVRPAGRPSGSGRQPDGRPPRRRPAPVPPPLLDESPAAAAHLLRLSGAYVLVDGYNVSMTAWGSVPVAEQRERLLDLLDELHARIGVTPVVVFDGVSASGAAAAPVGRSVRVRFTDEGVEADDVLIAMVDEVPAHRPVVVVSSDGRVREGAQRRGANVVGAAQFLAAAGRS